MAIHKNLNIFLFQSVHSVQQSRLCYVRSRNWGQAEMNTTRGWNTGIVVPTLNMSDLENGSSYSKDKFIVL